MASRSKRRRKVAYFSMEFGIRADWPIYSGGLGVLAGDHLKAAGDLKIPMIGVGLLYREGYFSQGLTKGGAQRERYPRWDPGRRGLRPAMIRNREELRVEVDLAGERVLLRAWRGVVGPNTLLLLDSDLPQNSPAARRLTDRLYSGGPEKRIRQEILLALGGLRTLRVLGWDPDVIHLNEGHCAFAVFERLREEVEGKGKSFEAAVRKVRRDFVFTTHTPVPAGNEVFGAEMAKAYFEGLARRIGVPWPRLLSLGQRRRKAGADLEMTVLALRFARRANGVSRRHGQVARRMWEGVRAVEGAAPAPLSSITNGVHVATWMAPEWMALLKKRLGSGFFKKVNAPRRWEGIRKIEDRTIWRIREKARRRLRRRLGWKDDRPMVVGFARRFALYKRASLIFEDERRLERLLNDPQRPVRLAFAGKAHPRDAEGKRLLRRIVSLSRRRAWKGKIVFLPGHDIDLSKILVQGVDVWLNTPQPPMEASGTSGMKAALNGVLNLSIADGWWREGYRSGLGWRIADSGPKAGSPSLYDLLEKEVVPLFFERERGLPRKWISRMRASVSALGPRFSAARMVSEYDRRFYRR